MKLNERLAKMEEKLDDLNIHFTNHLSHHSKYSFWAWTTTVGLLIYLLVKK